MLELRVRIVGHAQLLQMPRALRFEYTAYVSNQLRNLSGRLSAGVHAVRAGSYRPRNFLFRSASARGHPCEIQFTARRACRRLWRVTDRGRTTLETAFVNATATGFLPPLFLPISVRVACIFHVYTTYDQRYSTINIRTTYS